MGMTLWLQTRADQMISCESDDYSLLYQLIAPLDVMCTQAGVQLFSDFLDTTDMQYNMYCDDEDSEVDSSSGMDTMRWFDISAGLSTLTMLQHLIKTGALREYPDVVLGLGMEMNIATVSALLHDELASGLAVLRPLANQNAQFHFALVM